MKTLNVTPEQLAKEFAFLIRKWLTDEELEMVNALNTDVSNICATHDFCDPNQAMIDALTILGITADVQNEEQVVLMNKAWEIAKTNNFFA